MEDEFYIDYAKLDDIQRGFVDRKINKSMVVTGTGKERHSPLFFNVLRYF